MCIECCKKIFSGNSCMFDKISMGVCTLFFSLALVVCVLLFNVHCKQLWSCRDGQLT